MPTPDDVAGLVAWYTADPLYCFTDAAGTAPCADGDLVRVWKDRKGANHLSQATEANRPTYRDQGGYRYVDFGGTQYLDSSTPWFTAAPGSMAVWLYPEAASVAPVSVGQSGSSTNRFTMAVQQSGATLLWRCLAQTNGATALTGFAAPTGWLHAVFASGASNSRAAYVNGGNKGANATSATPTGINLSRIGGTNNLSTTLTGQLAEAAVWSAALADQDVADLYASGVPTYTPSGNRRRRALLCGR